MNKYKELIKNTGIIAIGKMSVQILNILLLPMYTKYLSADEYGQAELILVYVALLLPIVSLQIEQSLFRELADNRNNREKQGIISSTILIAAYFMGFFLSIGGGIVIKLIKATYGYFFVFILVWNLIFNMHMYYARGIGDNITYSMGSFIQMIVMVILNVLLIGILRYGIVGMLVANLGGYFIASIFIFFRLGMYKKIKISLVRMIEIPKCLKYSAPMIPNALSWWVLSASDKLTVKIFIGLSASGILSVSHKFGNIYNSIFNIFLMAWQESAIVHKEDENVEEFFSAIINHAILLFGTFGLIVVAAIPFVFEILIDAQYNLALNLMPLYVAGAFWGIIAGLVSSVHVAYGDSRGISRTTIAGAIINIVVNVLLIRYIGVYASPISTIVSNIIVALWRIIDSQKYVKIAVNYQKILMVTILFAAFIATYYISDSRLRIIGNLVLLLIIAGMNYPLINFIFKKAKGLFDGQSNR